MSNTEVELINSTVARNSATQEGGGILVVGFDPLVMLTNSLVARNSAPTGPDVLVGPDAVALARFSLIGDGSGSGITNTNGNQVGSASVPIDPKLGPLANNGGPTRTHALLLGSPAIDAASTPDCPTIDQRGVLRPQGAACDIGSYERKRSSETREQNQARSPLRLAVALQERAAPASRRRRGPVALRSRVVRRKGGKDGKAEAT